MCVSVCVRVCVCLTEWGVWHAVRSSAYWILHSSCSQILSGCSWALTDSVFLNFSWQRDNLDLQQHIDCLTICKSKFCVERCCHWQQELLMLGCFLLARIVIRFYSILHRLQWWWLEINQGPWNNDNWKIWVEWFTIPKHQTLCCRDVWCQHFIQRNQWLSPVQKIGHQNR